jgi:hypothetical protein
MTQVPATGERATSSDPEARRRVRGSTLGILLGLVVQFLAGMWVNLFVDIPDQHPGAKPDEYFSGSFQSVVWAITHSGLPALVFHAVLGLLLVLGSASLAIQAWRLHRRSLRAAGVLGFLLVLGAGFNGASFLDFGEDFSSMIMATLFALALVCYVSILFVLAGDRPGET